MKIKKNGKVIRLTESDLKRIVKRTLNEQMTDKHEMGDFCAELELLCQKYGISCDCGEVIKVMDNPDIEDNPFSI